MYNKIEIHAYVSPYVIYVKPPCFLVVEFVHLLGSCVILRTFDMCEIGRILMLLVEDRCLGTKDKT